MGLKPEAEDTRAADTVAAPTPTTAPDVVVTTPAPESVTAPPRPLRERLRAAFIEAYCAQRQGRTLKLDGIYRAHGFDGSSAWTAAWNAERDDLTWTAEVSRAARAACR